MPAQKQMDRILPLMREFGALEKKRAAEGVTPLEYQRWLELHRVLESKLPTSPTPPGAERRRHPRVPTRMLIQFRSRDQLRDAIITSVSRGGLFINTPFCAEIGEQFMLALRVDSTSESVDVPCEVVSTQLGADLHTERLGMGVKFTSLTNPQREAVDRLFSAALGEHYGGEGWG